MVGPDGEQSWCRADYKTNDPGRAFTAVDAFCDENGNATTDFPSMHWKNEFIPTPTSTRVEVEITLSSEADMEKIIELGFKEGFTAAHTNLDELLQPVSPTMAK
jgi:PhnB protein